MRVAERYREAVRRVVGARDFGEAEQEAHHALHGFLVGAPAPANRALDLGGLVFADRDAHLLKREQDHAARVADAYGVGDISSEKEFFHRRLARFQLRDKRANIAREGRKAYREACCGIGMDNPVRDMADFVPARLYTAIAGGGETRINPKYICGFILR